MLSNSSASYVFNVPQAPNDTISCVSWFPISQNNQTLLAASSWDKTVRVWDVRADTPSNCQIQAKTMFSHEAPVLGCCFSRQNALFSGGCDNLVKVHNLATNQSQVVGKHDAPVSAVAFDDEKNICITGSWDKTIRFWDCRQQNPVHTCNLNAKVYSMDFSSPVLVAAGSDRKVYAISMQNPQANPMVIDTVLKMQLRSIRITRTKQGVACGSIEGRCAITYFEAGMKSNNFAFKCHRVEERGTNKVYPVNSLAFHPTRQSIMVSAGSDGTVNIWEIEKRFKVKELENMRAPVTQAIFDSSGQLLACAASYDWHKGCNAPDQAKIPNKFVVHSIQPQTFTQKTS